MSAEQLSFLSERYPHESSSLRDEIIVSLVLDSRCGLGSSWALVRERSLIHLGSQEKMFDDIEKHLAGSGASILSIPLRNMKSNDVLLLVTRQRPHNGDVLFCYREANHLRAEFFDPEIADLRLQELKGQKGYYHDDILRVTFHSFDNNQELTI